MRIIEFAKRLDTTPRDLLKQAIMLGVEARTILSRLDDEDIEQIEKGLQKRLSIELADEESRMRNLAAEKAEKARAMLAEKNRAEAEALNKAILKAREIEAALQQAAAVEEVDESKPSDVVAGAESEDRELEVPSEVEEVAPSTPVSVEKSLPDTEATAAKSKPKAKRPPRPFDPESADDEEELLSRHGVTEKQTVRKAGKAGKGVQERAERRTTPARAEKRIVKKAVPEAAPEVPEDKALHFHGPVIVKDLAAKLGVRPNIVITELMKQGVLASINQSVDAGTAARVAEAHGFTVERDRPRRKAEQHAAVRRVDADDDIPEDSPEDLLPRPPVVTFLGHVDHGKTSLMDRIRSASVVEGESGGITQHVGAYSVDVNGQTITFLDTPGHAAFSAMRARGASLTDIAVIIIAADDGIMPQTREAIQHARKADVSIMVAINKCDLPQANPERIMQQLQSENLTPEEWGGDVVVCQVSAMTGEGLDNLLDMILLQAEVLELRANPNRRANGTVIEAQIEPGRGPIASILVTGGTLRVGDALLCGEHYGRLRAIINSKGNLIKSATPSMAVQIMGLSGVPEASSEFRVMTNEKRARQLAEEYAQKRKEETLGITQARSVDDIFRQMHAESKLELSIILRADVQGSVEAIEDSLAEIKSDKIDCTVIQSGTGNITSTDVQRAASGTAVIVGFHVSPESGVNAEARHFGVRIRTFRIIYELLDYVRQEMLSLLPIEHEEVVRGHALIKQVFSLSRKGNVAGCIVQDGVMTIVGKVRIFRDQKIIFTGAFSSIRHFQDEVREVSAGQECGLRFENFDDFHEGDIIECFVLEELPKAL